MKTLIRTSRARHLLSCAMLLALGCGGSASVGTGSSSLPDGAYAVIREAATPEGATVTGTPYAVAVYDRKYVDATPTAPPRYLAIATSDYVPLILARPPETERDEQGRASLSLTLAREYLRALEDFTREHLGGSVAILLDGEVVTMHKVQSVVRGGQLKITRCSDDACEILKSKLAD